MVSSIMARAALPENGLTSAVGSASTKRVSQPALAASQRMPSSRKSSAPEARSTPTAHSIATRYGSRLLAMSKPSLAPSMKASYTGTFLQAPTMRKASRMPNSARLPISDDSAAMALADMLASSAMKPPSSSAAPPSHSITTGSTSRRRWHAATARKPASVDALVASRIGRNTRVGSGAPCCARNMNSVTGSSVSDEALSTRNRIWALLAVSGLGLSDCSSRMARRPIGVAALSSPRPLAAKLSVIKPIAGWLRGTSGIRRANSGPSSRASFSTSPAPSAMRRNPSHSVSVPNSSTITSTDTRAMSNRLATMARNTSGSPMASQRYSAAAAAVRKKPSQSLFSMRCVPG